MNTYKKAIGAIIKFKQELDSIHHPKIPKKLLGDLGELYVLSRLHGLGGKGLKPKGGQAGFDIYLEDNDKKIEVRTSLLKNEGLYSKETRFFGWRVKNRNQKRQDKFDILIGVGLDESFKKPKFYIFTRREALTVQDVKIGRFKNVQKKIHFFENKTMYKKAIRLCPDLVTRYERYINLHPLEFRDRWDKVL